MARCYRPNVTSTIIDKELEKAGAHIKPTIFDCFKFLNVNLHDVVVQFEKDVVNVYSTTIQNGEFYNDHKKLRKKAIEDLRLPKNLKAETDLHEAVLKYLKRLFKPIPK